MSAERLQIQDNLVNLHIWEQNGSPFIFDIHGASSIERRTREIYLAAKTLPLIKDKVTGIKQNVSQIALNEGYSAAAIDALDLILTPAFGIPQYEERLSLAFKEIYKRNDIKVAVGESVGALALFGVIADRIEKGEKVPEVAVAINFPIGGLSKGSEWYLDRSGQFGEHMLPALGNLRRNSEYLNALKSRIYRVRDVFPSVFVIVSQMPESFTVAPWGASSNPSTVGKAVARGFEKGGDGMFNTDGLNFRISPEADKEYLVNPNKLVVFVLQGAVHNDGYHFGLPFIREVIKKGAMPETSYGSPLVISVESKDYIRKSNSFWNKASVRAVIDFYSRRKVEV